MVVEGGAGADVDAGRHVRLHVVVELWQQVVAAVVLVAVEHDGAQRVRPRDLRAEGRATRVGGGERGRGSEGRGVARGDERKRPERSPEQPERGT